MAAVGIAAIALGWAMIQAATAVVSPVRRRLKALREDGPVASAGGSSGIARFLSLFEPSKESERAGMKLRLVQAGFRGSSALGVLYGSKLILGVLLPIAIWFVLPLFPKIWSNIFFRYGALLLTAFVGLQAPDKFMNQAFESRKRKLLEGLPDALDLLVTCTEAGLGLNAALERVVEQLPGSHPELAFELGQVNAEIRAGIERNVALKNLGDRTGLDEIHGLVSLISHSTRLGTGIAGTLRIYADDFRDRRMQRAEELAATVGTKLIFPLILCLFPAFLAVAVGPAIIGMAKVFAEK